MEEERKCEKCGEKLVFVTTLYRGPDAIMIWLCPRPRGVQTVEELAPTAWEENEWPQREVEDVLVPAGVGEWPGPCGCGHVVAVNIREGE